jgi:hypothetical protein
MSDVSNGSIVRIPSELEATDEPLKGEPLKSPLLIVFEVGISVTPIVSVLVAVAVSARRRAAKADEI